MASNEVYWTDRKRPFLGLPLSFTKYTLTEKFILIQTGFFNSEISKVRLYKVKDTSWSASFWQKLFGLGTIRVMSDDEDTPELEIENITFSKDVERTILELADQDMRNSAVHLSRPMHGDARHARLSSTDM
ncbi:MAG: PH domain-containing protein [Oscillospiraceae bacterium]|jgi:uncharacterized membrane protein YdbT with pleckstrin-like domain|nr:PH domain-containing protein [Oscillospiraceae bacterium]